MGFSIQWLSKYTIGSHFIQMFAQVCSPSDVPPTPPSLGFKSLEGIISDHFVSVRLSSNSNTNFDVTEHNWLQLTVFRVVTTSLKMETARSSEMVMPHRNSIRSHNSEDRDMKTFNSSNNGLIFPTLSTNIEPLKTSQIWQLSNSRQPTVTTWLSCEILRWEQHEPKLELACISGTI